MNRLTMSFAAAILCLCNANVFAGDDVKIKRTLKNNMMEVYKITPTSADNLTEAFSNGVLYGRLRANWFKWDWDQVNYIGETLINQDNKALGVGGSLIYKTAPLLGISAGAGLYYADSPFHGMRMNNDMVKYTKAGKDTFSRYNVSTEGTWAMAVLAQAYAQYDVSKTSFKAGRQIFESFLTKSNDTKMIPNTFEGYTIDSKELDSTRIRAAYFTAQKLRDHTTFHDLITFKDSEGNRWNNNDDAAVHRGLSYDNFVAAGQSPENNLIVADIRNTSLENLKLDVTYGLVPDVVGSLTAEANYKIKFSGGYSLTPGVRYMYQMDEGGGAIGGSALSGLLAGWKEGDDKRGYSDPSSLDASLIAARLVFKVDALKLQAGYSAIADDADIVAPWRGFPTGGYTRAMAQYNWFSNTKTTSVEAFYDFSKADVIPGFRMLTRYASQDFDETKGLPDSNILHIDMWKKFASLPNFEAKVRIGILYADEFPSTDKDLSYNEYRFELNYLF
ncbi:MAG: OprD family outer membrane porin [Campylobacterota bacterium]|nr:OprD family outer membrane porin [Campylobacterota bacterium]